VCDQPNYESNGDKAESGAEISDGAPVLSMDAVKQCILLEQLALIVALLLNKGTLQKVNVCLDSVAFGQNNVGVRFVLDGGRDLLYEIKSRGRLPLKKTHNGRLRNITGISYRLIGHIHLDAVPVHIGDELIGIGFCEICHKRTLLFVHDAKCVIFASNLTGNFPKLNVYTIGNQEYDCATGTNNPDHPMGGGYSVAAKTPAPSLKKFSKF
jgi:hypothetical protein